jgi:hypothetical protein
MGSRKPAARRSTWDSGLTGTWLPEACAVSAMQARMALDISLVSGMHFCGGLGLFNPFKYPKDFPVFKHFPNCKIRNWYFPNSKNF